MIDPADFRATRALLDSQGVRPRKRWGQNFLCNRNALQRIAEAAVHSPDDRVLEIGPGLGALTQALASRAAHVTAVEIDPIMVAILPQTVGAMPNVDVIQGDFLELCDTKLMDRAFGHQLGVVAANVPYYITTPILEKLLDHRHRIREMVILTQREFAERMAAPVGSEKAGLLSVWVQMFAEVEILFHVKPEMFYPQPDVTSTVVRIRMAPHPDVAPENADWVRKVAGALFAQRRKTAHNTLAAGIEGLTKDLAADALNEAELDPGARGETFTLPQLARLASAVGNRMR